MKLTKYVHACVLVEDDQLTTLFDPGQFSLESGLFDVNKLEKLDFVVITHEHFDHFYEPFVQVLVQKFPDVQFLSTPEVVRKLLNLGITNALNDSNDFVKLSPLNHDSMEPLNPGPMCQNVAVNYKEKISHPGDSHHLADSKEVLFLPLAGPWGSTIEAVRMAVKLRPKVIVPIHDWMWNDKWRNTMYDRMEVFFAEQDIRFVKTTDGESFQV